MRNLMGVQNTKLMRFCTGFIFSTFPAMILIENNTNKSTCIEVLYFGNVVVQNVYVLVGFSGLSGFYYTAAISNQLHRKVG